MSDAWATEAAAVYAALSDPQYDAMRLCLKIDYQQSIDRSDSFSEVGGAEDNAKLGRDTERSQQVGTHD